MNDSNGGRRDMNNRNGRQRDMSDSSDRNRDNRWDNDTKSNTNNNSNSDNLQMENRHEKRPSAIRSMASTHKTLTVLRCKVVIVGDAKVGKSALAQMFHSGGHNFPKNYIMTIG